MERRDDCSFVNLHSKLHYELGKHAPIKKMYVKANQKNGMDYNFET